MMQPPTLLQAEPPSLLRFWYVDSMELPGPTDDINVLLRQVVPEDSTTARTRAARIFIPQAPSFPPWGTTPPGGHC